MKKLLKFFVLFIVGLAVVFTAMFFYTGYTDAKALQQRNPLADVVHKEVSSADYVPYDQIDPFLLKATVCVEDARFFEHAGLDFIGICRGILSQFLPFLQKSGGSSITQQVVKNLYGRYEAGLEWKGAEMVLALELEKMLTKEEILALYVNIINYGDNYIGIRNASVGYFNVIPLKLTEAEGALLAGIPQSPANYQLSDHYQQAKAKQLVVLNAMVRNKVITQHEADEIYAQPIHYLSHGTWMEDGVWSDWNQ